MTTRRWLFVIFLAIFLIIVAVGLYSLYDPAAIDLFPKCPFKLLTGLSCPACGLQRSFHSLLCGNICEALSYNYFFILSIPYAIAIIVAYVCRKLHRGSRYIRFVEHKYGVYTYIVLFFVWFIIRNILGI